MIQVIRANARHFTDFGWLKTYWFFRLASIMTRRIFSLAPCACSMTMSSPRTSGFGTHSHEEMEILTIVLEAP
jgi:hypothetical protein